MLTHNGILIGVSVVEPLKAELMRVCLEIPRVAARETDSSEKQISHSAINAATLALPMCCQRVRTCASAASAETHVRECVYVK